MMGWITFMAMVGFLGWLAQRVKNGRRRTTNVSIRREQQNSTPQGRPDSNEQQQSTTTEGERNKGQEFEGYLKSNASLLSSIGICISVLLLLGEIWCWQLDSSNFVGAFLILSAMILVGVSQESIPTKTARTLGWILVIYYLLHFGFGMPGICQFRNGAVQVPSLSSSPSPTPLVEYKGDPVGEIPYHEGAITVESRPRTIIAKTNGVVKICTVESKYSFEGALGSLIQEIGLETSFGEKDLLISSTTECQQSKIKLTKGQKFKIWLKNPDRDDLRDLPNFRHPTASIE